MPNIWFCPLKVSVWKLKPTLKRESHALQFHHETTFHSSWYFLLVQLLYKLPRAQDCQPKQFLWIDAVLPIFCYILHHWIKHNSLKIRMNKKFLTVENPQSSYSRMHHPPTNLITLWSRNKTLPHLTTPKAPLCLEWGQVNIYLLLQNVL